ncbi:MAG TPA: PIG-L family deacetylase [Acidimicrobiia bacterium]
MPNTGTPKTLVAFHAHPDDEAIATSGTMMKAKAAGHRVLLVVATRGELGLVPDDLAPGESLADRRTVETLDAASIIGAEAVEWLGYRDSGMEGEPSIDDDGTFHRADVDEAAQRLAAILEREHVDMLLTYDERGNYMHPDHVKVHHVGHRAAKLAGTPVVYEATVNRDFIWNLMHEERDQQDMPNDLGTAETIEEFNLGMREWTITHRIAVTEFVERKRAAMAAHRSQIDETSFFLQLPPDAFARSFGYEWFIRPEHPRDTGAPFLDDLFDAFGERS